MRLPITTVTLLAAISVVSVGLAKKEDDLPRLIERAKTASVEQQAHLYTDIAELELKFADQSYSADQVSKGRAAVTEVVTYADKASAGAIESGRRLKDTEIAMRKMSTKLRDMKRKLALEDQAPLQEASDHLESLRTKLLTHMFRKK